MAAGSDDTAATLLDAEQAARVAHVPDSTFRRWVSERRLAAHCAGDDGRDRYLEADVLNAEAATRRGPRSARLLAEAMRHPAARAGS